MNIQVERTKYDNHEIIKLLFDYDKDIVAKIRTISGARWSRSMRCWYVSDQPQKITALQNIGINVEQKIYQSSLLTMLTPNFYYAFPTI